MCQIVGHLGQMLVEAYIDGWFACAPRQHCFSMHTIYTTIIIIIIIITVYIYSNENVPATSTSCCTSSGDASSSPAFFVASHCTHACAMGSLARNTRLFANNSPTTQPADHISHAASCLQTQTKRSSSLLSSSSSSSTYDSCSNNNSGARYHNAPTFTLIRFNFLSGVTFVLKKKIAFFLKKKNN